ncbi:hypothetical protein DFP79_3486 [Marinomonas balearica]|uniref:Uncharacterized protein n=1 Tax=Marinomonas balearica TaxID=491947 RepID=A0A4R6M4C3_9GAMM|nr:hypothetical protein DFP79_3486 [Marinomonas balearica]
MIAHLEVLIEIYKIVFIEVVKKIDPDDMFFRLTI